MPNCQCQIITLMKNLFFFIFLLISLSGYSQTTLQGTILDEDGDPVESASVQLSGYQLGTSTDQEGKFNLTLPDKDNWLIRVTHINYQPLDTTINFSVVASKPVFRLKYSVTTLSQVEIRGSQTQAVEVQPSTFKVDPIAAKVLPTPFGEFNMLLSTLPGVVSNNELSSAYQVRGGNFDENLVYVNDIPVYRPFLIRAGQQEGLSFVNPDLVSGIQFSSGGWQAKYGDKLSSNLLIDYKKPQSFGGSVTLGLLGGALHLEGASSDKKLSYLLGIRHKRSQYLLNTLETQGEYLPQFTDLQSFINYKISPKSELGVLMAYASNRYLVVPENRETTFGNLQEGFLRLFVAFAGRELMEYDTYQSGVKFTQSFNKKFKSHLITSVMTTREREYQDLEGGYRLCDVNKQVGSQDFDRCLSIRGIGTNFTYARNRLNATVINTENRNELKLNNNNTLEFGVGAFHQVIDDVFQEYSFLDSADFVAVDYNVEEQQQINGTQVFGYVQDKMVIDSIHHLNVGIRVNYFDINRQLLLSPRLQYAFFPKWKRETAFKLSLGYYQQPPFYREFRNFQGQLNLDLLAQSSIHMIAGFEHNLELWNRPFNLSSEIYYKHLYNVVPYDVDNVRIRYLAKNNATAFATGIDFRLSGEFVPGTQSWFSLSVLSTREDVENDGQGFIRRPSDQNINLGVYFEDYLPNDPTMRMNLNLLVGSGLPFGPPNNIRNRSAFSGEIYRRVDLGLSKLIKLDKMLGPGGSLWLGVEILNLLGADNVISYTWIKDFNDLQYGVPNSLSARFLNIRAMVNY